MKRDRVFAIDIDGTTHDFMGGMSEYVFNRWQHRIDLAQHREFSLARLTPHEDINRDILMKLEDEDFYDEYVKPFPFAESALHRLLPYGRIVFITARPKMKVTGQPSGLYGMTRRDLTFRFGSKIFNEQSSLAMVKDKIKAARKLAVTYAFEDHPTHAQEYQKHRIPCYMIQYPFNTHVAPNYWIRPAANLMEAVLAFEQSVRGMEAEDFAWPPSLLQT